MFMVGRYCMTKMIISSSHVKETLSALPLRTDKLSLSIVPADEKRKSISFTQKEKLCVSVKAISALYLSKVAPQEPKQRLLTQVTTTVLTIHMVNMFTGSEMINIQSLVLQFKVSILDASLLLRSVPQHSI